MKLRITENDIQYLIKESIKRICEQVIDDTTWSGYFNAARYLNDKYYGGEYYDEDNEITRAEYQLKQLNIPCGFDFSIYNTGGISGMGPDDDDGDIKCTNTKELMPLLNILKTHRNNKMLNDYYTTLYDFVNPRSLQELQMYYEEYVEDVEENTISAEQWKDYML